MNGFISKFAHAGLSAALAASLAGISIAASASDSSADAAGIESSTPADVASAVRALPHARILQAGADGIPVFMRGDLGHAGRLAADPALADQTLRSKLRPALRAMRVVPDDLSLRRVSTDAAGNRHFRYRQLHEGLEVVGGELAVHTDAKGTVYGVNGAARSDISPKLDARDIGGASAQALVTADPRYVGMVAAAPRAVYVVADEGRIHKAYETVVSGERGQDPVRDKVYVDMASGAIVAVHPQIQFAESRKIYSANNGTALPGTLKRSEGGAAASDADINTSYDYIGDTYEAYKAFWSRDSYNNAGATLIGSIHYSSNYCNAYWDSTQMVYGDGDASQGCLPLDRAVDVTAHELTHAVTENESGLTYSGESGGLNEAMSDIFGAFVEAWVDGGKTGPLTVSGDTWKVGEDILPPALRYMNDPAKDGSSLDYWTSSSGNVDVHYSSGIANLAFYLMSQGGTHPRGKSTVNVTGIGMDKAIRVFYKANVDILTASSKFLAAGNASVQAAQELGYSLAEQVSVANAWQAVGVAVPTPGGGGGGGGGTDTVLSNGVPVTGLSGATSSQKFFSLVVPAGQASLTFVMSGGTGDADLYVLQGAHPTLTSYSCRPYTNGNAETCTIASPAAGTWYVMLNGYAAYSGVSLTGSYAAAADDGVPQLSNGVAVTGISGASGSAKYWKIQTPSAKTLTVKISGGTGDADLYTRVGAKPTTSTYTCRPYLTGNSETCSIASTTAGYTYIMIRGYAAYSGLSLLATY